MKTIHKSAALRKIANVLALAALAFTSTGCSLFHEDLEPCAVKPITRTSVRFVYDYNTADSDRFAEEVGGVSLYVFDASDRLLTIEEFSNSASGNMLKHGDFKVEFESDRIEPGKAYTFYAVAHGHNAGYTGAISLPGAAFRRTELLPGVHTPSDFSITLDSDGDGIVDHQGVMIDALFVSRKAVRLEVPEEIEPSEGDSQEPDHLIDVEIPLMRVTNTVTISFWQSDFPAKIDPAQYEFEIESATGSKALSFVGTPLENHGLKYLPVRTWTDTRDIDGMPTACINAEFGLSRIMLESDLHVNVRRLSDGSISRINHLPSLLAAGREAYASKAWGMQEYLDRQNIHSLTVALDGSVPKWAQVSIGILSWSKRIQLEDF